MVRDTRAFAEWVRDGCSGAGHDFLGMLHISEKMILLMFHPEAFVCLSNINDSLLLVPTCLANKKILIEYLL